MTDIFSPTINNCNDTVCGYVIIYHLSPTFFIFYFLLFCCSMRIDYFVFFFNGNWKSDFLHLFFNMC